MKAALFVVVLVSSTSCVSPTAPSAKQWICTTQERCSYDALYRRTCRVDQYVSDKPCPATPIS
jgi:hypothetical protein